MVKSDLLSHFCFFFFTDMVNQMLSNSKLPIFAQTVGSHQFSDNPYYRYMQYPGHDVDVTPLDPVNREENIFLWKVPQQGGSQ